MKKLMILLLCISFNLDICAVTELPELRDMIGQLIIVGFKGAELSEDFKRQMTEYNLSGVILFDRDYLDRSKRNNILNPTQLGKLTTEIKEIAKTKPFISIDQEGGYIERLRVKDGFIEVDNPANLSKLGPKAVACSAIIIASQLSQAGINLNFAPNVDLRIGENKVAISRSYGENPTDVTKLSKIFIDTHGIYNIFSTIKHFPGLSAGEADKDTHSKKVYMDSDSDLIQKALRPFKKLKNTTDIIMVSHLINPIDNLPSSLSKESLKLLRKEVEYSGVSISDDMDMLLATTDYTLEEAATMGLNAGLDLLLFGNTMDYDPKKAEKIVLHIEREVNKGNISRDRIKEAYLRVSKLKKKINKKESITSSNICKAEDLKRLWPLITRSPDEDDKEYLYQEQYITNYQRWFNPSFENIKNMFPKSTGFRSSAVRSR